MRPGRLCADMEGGLHMQAADTSAGAGWEDARMVDFCSQQWGGLVGGLKAVSSGDERT